MGVRDINVGRYDSSMVEGLTRTKKITIEVEVPVGKGADIEVDRLLELLRKGAPLNVSKEDLRRTKIYDKRSRY